MTNKDIRISDDVLVSLVGQEGNLFFTIIIQDGYRETRSINLIDEEITVETINNIEDSNEMGLIYNFICQFINVLF